MIVLRLNGGLGNQMFQYAFSKMLSNKYNQQLYFDMSQFKDSNRRYSLDLFAISPHLLTEIKTEDIQRDEVFHLQEDQFNFDETALNALDSHDLMESIFLISGYWQSYKYFSNISSLIRDEFRLSYQIDQTYLEIDQLIKNTESVMIHVRRGDYLLNGNLDKHGVVDTDYIERGMSFFEHALPNALFFIFSDDPEWCMTNIELRDNIVFIKKDSDDGRTSFSLMRQCKYFLISNSTFSWWAAWLSDYPKKHVICPKNWFLWRDIDASDLIPPEWDQY